ncbi:MAG: hypothetical protein ACREV9_03980 [Burkholderiales bacterium]
MKWPFFVLLLANFVLALYALLHNEPDRREPQRLEQQLDPEKIRLLP